MQSTSFNGNSVLHLGPSDYREAHKLQLEIHSAVVAGNASEKIIMTEHFPVYTCGRGIKNQKSPSPFPLPLGERVRVRGIPVIDVERGGQITYHGPGQMVGYPILNLQKRRLSIPQYLRKLENALIETLREFGIEAEYREEHRAGLWVAPHGAGKKKLVSIGIAVRHWVTFHGFALNVDCDLTPFHSVNPCGLPGRQITSLKEMGCLVDKKEVERCVVKNLIKTFF